MNATTEVCRCYTCRKAIAPAKVQRMAVETEGKPAEIFTMCPRCALRIARNVVRLERAQGQRVVLQA